ncbi:MAG: hypothetical protein AB7H93_23600 [Vicinamibacterales bacterium]
MPPRLDLALSGRLAPAMERSRAGLARSIRTAVLGTTAGTRDGMRALVRGALGAGRGRKGSRVANVIRQAPGTGKVFEDGEFRVAGFLYSDWKVKGPNGRQDLLAAHVHGATVVPASPGGWLYIPLQGNRRGRRSVPGRTHGKLRIVGRERGLRFVPLSGGRMLLVKDRRGRTQPEVIALLVKRVVVPPRLRGIEQIVAAAPDNLARRLAAEMAREGL